MRILLDTNVYIYRFVPPQYVSSSDRSRWTDLHSKAKIVYDNILARKHQLIIPSVVLVEIASVVQSITGDEAIAAQATDELKKLVDERIAEIAYLDDLLMNQSISFVFESKLKAIDAVIATCCLIKQASLLTNDGELYTGVISLPLDPVIPYRIDAYILRDVSEAQLNQLFDP